MQVRPLPFGDALRLVHDRLDEFQQSGDPDIVLCVAATEETDALYRAMQANTDPRQLGAACHALGWLAYWRYNELPRGPDQPELARALTMLAPFADTPTMLPESMCAVLGPDAVPASQSGLATGLLQYAQAHDDHVVLEAAIDLLATAVEATPAGHPDRSEHLDRLAAAHCMRFDRTGQVADVRRAVELGETALAETPEDNPARAGVLYNLRGIYHARFEHTNDPQDLTRAIMLGEQALAAIRHDDHDRLRFLSSLGQAYRERFEHLGDADDLQRAIDAGTEALAGTPEDSPKRARMLHSLRGSYRTRYHAGGDLTDLARAIELGEQALAATGDDDPERVRYLSNLGGMYADRFERLGATADLSRGIELNERALCAAPPQHADRPGMLANLGRKYLNRFDRFGDPADLDRAVAAGEQAVASTPDDHTSAAPRLSMLSGACLQRYGYAGALDDLDRGIELGERALAAAPRAHPNRFIYEFDLCGGYVLRFGRTHVTTDLDRAVELGEAAVSAAPESHTQRGSALLNLASAYLTRYTAAGRGPGRTDTVDLDRAISLTERVLAETPGDHPDRPYRAGDLGRMFHSRFTARGQLDDLERAIESQEQALAATPDDHPDLATTVNGLARAYMTWANMVFREDIDRAKVRAIAARAAGAEAAAPAARIHAGLAIGALALTIDDPATAAQALDQAVALLPAIAPGELDRVDQEHRLGDHFSLAAEAISAHLANGDPVGAVAVAEASRGLLLAEQLENRTELDAMAHDLLRPPEPIRGRAGGTVVLLNMGITRRDAVLITADTQPRTVELPDGIFFPHLSAEDLIDATQAAPSLASTLRRRRVVGDILRWLWDDVVAPVLAALPDAPEPHRIWWLPVGYLAVLPFHAAGHPGEAGALDHAISSYVPTLRSLDQARRRPAAAARRQLTVDLSHVPQMPDLPGTAAEAAELHAQRPDGSRLSNEDATAAGVLAGLADRTWAHFACHAHADLATPSQGGLRLHDRVLRLSEVSNLRLEQAELAYLSACSTAHVGVRHANETIHLASAFQLAGFRHVIASLWPVADDIAAAAARAFYARMPDTPDANTAAATLRAVTMDLRESYPDRPDLWASLVHSGP